MLHFVSPAVTPTNHLFNVIAIPSGVYRYMREGRMVWPLATLILLGTVPGVVLGSLARIRYLPDPRHFKLFMAGVLLLIASRLIVKVLRPAPAPAPVAPRRLRVRTLRFDLRRLEYEFAGERHGVSTPALFVLTAVVGIIGGAYGVGGGAIIAPFLVSFFGLPVHTIAGATLCGTWLTSAVAVGFFTVAEPLLGLAGSRPTGCWARCSGWAGWSACTAARGCRSACRPGSSRPCWRRWSPAWRSATWSASSGAADGARPALAPRPRPLRVPLPPVRLRARCRLLARLSGPVSEPRPPAGAGDFREQPDQAAPAAAAGARAAAALGRAARRAAELLRRAGAPARRRTRRPARSRRPAARGGRARPARRAHLAPAPPAGGRPEPRGRDARPERRR